MGNFANMGAVWSLAAAPIAPEGFGSGYEAHSAGAFPYARRRASSCLGFEVGGWMVRTITGGESAIALNPATDNPTYFKGTISTTSIRAFSSGINLARLASVASRFVDG